MQDIGWIGRRDVMRLLGAGGAALAAGLPERVHAATAKNTLVLGLDISDSFTFDPAREAQYTPPLRNNCRKMPRSSTLLCMPPQGWPIVRK